MSQRVVLVRSATLAQRTTPGLPLTVLLERRIVRDIDGQGVATDHDLCGGGAWGGMGPDDAGVTRREEVRLGEASAQLGAWSSLAINCALR